jgi:hypothetical protein
MSVRRCCKATSNGQGRGRTAARRCFDVAGWLVPGAVLAFLPKCPMCLAAYIAVGTVIGLSASAAGHLRTLLVILCSASLCYLAATRIPRLIASLFRTKETAMGSEVRGGAP